MRYRMLGRSQLMVSEVGFGGWAIGGQGWGPVDDETSTEAIRRAIECGVCFIDTADVYGEGHGEEVVGEALAGKRELAVIATKGGLRAPSGSDFSPAHIAAAVDASLARLRTDWIDLYQLHNPTRKALNDDSLWEALRSLKREGKIRAYGASVQAPSDGVLAIEKGGVDTVQVVFNVIDQEARSFFELAERENVGIIGRVPLASGFLTGKYDESYNFPPGDFRRHWSPERRLRVLRRARSLEPVAGELGSSRAQAALAFVLSYPAVSVTIPGVKTPQQARENAGSSDLAPLPPDLLRLLESSRNGSKEPRHD
jgi:aryl-alcohol dehydrogenase-like predicted oxidoreductase